MNCLQDCEMVSEWRGVGNGDGCKWYCSPISISHSYRGKPEMIKKMMMAGGRTCPPFESYLRRTTVQLCEMWGQLVAGIGQ